MLSRLRRLVREGVRARDGSPTGRRERPVRRAVAAWAAETLEPRWLFAFTPTPITQYHIDPASNGVNSHETLLTPSTVNVAQFGKQFSTPVDGQVYAEPLYVPGVNITSGPQQGVHNVVYVATEHDSLYAVDSIGGNVLWKTSFQDVEDTNVANGTATLTNPLGATAIVPMPAGETGSGDVTVEIGITATPVIDLPNKFIYLVAKSKQTIGGNADHYVQTLYKLDIGSGAVVASTVIGDTRYAGGAYTYVTTGAAASTPYALGTGDGATTVAGQSRVYFNGMREFGRVGLQLYNGTIYMGFASHGDNGPYHGWMLAYNASTLAISGALNTTPNGGLGGIWQGGGTIGVDPQGNFYFETGNGSFNTAASNFGTGYTGLPKDGNYGDTIVKVSLDPTTTPTSQNKNGWGLKVVDFFSPFNNTALNNADTDLGSSGLTILPDAVGSAAHPHLLVGSGKEGKIYLIDRDNMGGFNPTTDKVVQVQGSALSGLLNTPAFFLNNPSPTAPAKPSGTILFVMGYGGGAKAYGISDGVMTTAATSVTTNDFGYLPGSPTVSADGVTNGILWAVNRNNNKLYAYRADNLGVELWDSGQAAANRDQLGTAVKFSVPTVADGQVFVGTANALVVYGPPVPPTAPPAAPVGLTATAPFYNQVNLSWADQSSNEDVFRVERTTTPGIAGSWVEIGTTSANVAAYADTTVLSETAYSYRVRAFNSFAGGSYSAYTNVATVTTPAAPPTGTGDGLAANYYSDVGATAGSAHLNPPASFTRTDTNINFDFGTGSPAAGFPADNFSIRWTGQVLASTAGTYTFRTTADDGIRLYVDGTLRIDNFVDQGPTDKTYAATFSVSTVHAITVEYYENGGGAVAKLFWSTPASAGTFVVTPFVGGGATGSYFDDSVTTGAHLQGNPVLTRVDPTVDSVTRWPADANGYGDPDGTGTALTSANFSARWTGKVQAQYTETYTFHTESDDGVRLWVNGQLLINNWVDQGTTTRTATIALSGGQKYDIRVEYYEGGPGDFLQVRWSSPSTPDQVIPQSQLYSGVAPAAPTGLAAVATSGTQVNLSWADPSAIETGFVLERLDPGGAYVAVATLPPNTTSYFDTSLNPDTAYSYRVKATNFAADSTYSNVVMVTTPIPPAKPLNAHPTAVTTTTIAMAWDDVANNEDGYRISRSAADTDNFIVIAQLPPNSNSYFDAGPNGAGLTPGVEYEYHIQAFNVAGYNDFSGFRTATVTLAPTGLAATPGNGRNALTWTPPAFDGSATFMTFNVYRGTTAGGPYPTRVASGLSDPAYTDVGLTNGTAYYYVVTAVDAGGESAASGQAAGTPAAAGPPVVTGTTVGDGTPQRSMVTGLSVQFDRAVASFDAGAFTLTRRDGGAGTAVPMTVTLAADGLSVRLTFAGTGIIAGSLADGVYDWVIDPTKVRDASGQAGVGTAQTVTFHRLFGDQDGNTTVNNADNGRFRNAFGSSIGDAAYNPIFDYDGNGTVNNLDNGQFRNRFGTTLTYT